MRKLDSFFRETMRTSSTAKGEHPSALNNLLAHIYLDFPVTMQRKAMKDFTFSDGTFIPRGTIVAAIHGPINMDEEIYEDPLTFKPFRFAEAREGADVSAAKFQMVTTSPQYLAFGHGKHAW